MFLNKGHPLSTALKSITAIVGTLASTQALAGEQVVTPSITAFSVSPGDNIAFDVQYETRDPVNETLSGLGLRIHFDSSKVSLIGLSNILAKDLLRQGNAEDDNDNLDNDANTDKFISIVWAGILSSEWPGEGATPATLYNAAFSLNSDYNGSSQINFSAVDTASGYTLAFTPVVITEFINNPPVFGAISPISTEATDELTPITLTPPTVTDVEDGTLTPEVDNSGPFGVGITTVTWSATDSGGKTVTLPQQITVTDTTAPTITTPNDQTVEATANQSQVTLDMATAVDLVDGTVTVIPDTTGPFGVGIHTITWSAVDGEGNIATATSTLTITDNTPPSLIAPIDISQESASGEPIEIALPTVFGSDLVSGQIQAIPSHTGLFSPGETIVSWTAVDDAGNSASVNQTITVTTPDALPVIAILTDITQEATGQLTAVTLVAPIVTDSEDGPLDASADNLGPFPLKTTTVTWSATDSANQTVSTSQQIIITDTTAPTITTPNDQTVEATANQSQVTLDMATAVDLVDGTVTVIPDTTGPFGVGIHTITWSAVDGEGNIATATSTLTITDNTPPSLIAPIDISQESASGEPIEIALPTVFGSDLVSGQIQAIPSHTGLFSPGETIVSWTAVDDAGNSASVNQTITVTTPDALPVIAILTDITQEATGQLTAVTLVAPIVTDSEDGPLDASADNLGPFPLKTTTVTWSATDSANQTVSTSQQITILDTTAPIITTPDTQIVEATDNLTELTLNPATATDLVDLSVSVTTESKGPFAVDTHTVIWTSTDSEGNTATATSRLVVSDNTPPSLIAPADLFGESTSGEAIEITLPSVFGTDLVDGQVQATANHTGLFEPGATVVTWTATDLAGNSANVSHNVTVTTADALPTIATIADISMEATGELTAVALVAPSVSDNEDGVLVAQADKQSPFPVGTTVVTWSATDSANHTVSTTQQIEISDTTAPIITVPENLSIEATATLTPVTLTPATAIDLVDDNITVVAAPIGPYAVGTHNITWTASDKFNNTATATSQLEITDNTAPTMTAPATITQHSEDGEPLTIMLTSVMANDLVDGEFAAIADHTGTFAPGTTIVVWTATDKAGNSTSVNQSVIVTTPDALPVISVIADITMEATAKLTPLTLTPPSASDSEDGVLVAKADDTGPFAVGPTAITWSVTDSASQTVSLVQNITITDTTAPVIDPIVDQLVEAIASQTPVTLIVPTATDLVDGAVTATTTASESYSIGEHIIDWTAKDLLGNTVTASSRLKVVDTTAPEFIQIPEPISVLSLDGEAMTVDLPVVTAQDLVDGEVSAVVDNAGPYLPGEHTLVWQVADAAGNENTINQLVNVIVDNTSPQITAPDNITVEAIAVLTPVELVEPVVTDDIDEAVQVSVDNSGPFALGEHTLTWTATDASGNQTSVIQVITVVDTTAPEFAELTTITIDAKGFNTLVTTDKLGQVSANDLVDGVIEASLSEVYQLASGRHQINWSVVDQQGNTANAIQVLDILPLVGLGLEQFAGPGSQVSIPVILSGAAPVYPVSVELALSGNVVNDGLIPASLSILIEQGVNGESVFTLPENMAFVDNDTITITISQVDHAALAAQQQTLLTLVSHNQPPVITLAASQGNLNGLTFARSENIITVNAQVFDVNASDTHQLDWLISSVGVADLAQDGNPLTFEFIAQNITDNLIEVSLTATEDTAEALSTSVTISLSLTDIMPTLTDVDTDGDGINDADEGINDSDGDGIADYLDNDASTHRLPIAANNDPLETLPGLSIQVGETSLASQGFGVTGAGLTSEQLGEFGDNGSAATVTDEEYQAVSAIVDFVVSGLTTPGLAVPIVLPLPQDTGLPANAKYRKFTPQTGWVTFVDTNGNTLASAMRNSEGNCPTVGDESYQSGLNEGDQCIQLTIVDGGIYDADDQINGHIVDPGVISAENLRPVAELASQAISVVEGESVVVDGNASYDPEGLTLTYQWLQTAGTAADLTITEGALLSFNTPSVGESEVLIFALTVNDGTHDSIPKTVQVTVNNNALPVAVASTQQPTVKVGREVVLNGTESSDSENSQLTYAWMQVSGLDVALSDVTSATPSFIVTEEVYGQTLVFELVVNDGFQSSEAAMVSVKVEPKPTEPAVPKRRSSGGALWWLVLLMLPLVRVKRKQV